MLALYRSARQAEALEAYRAARRELSEELGLEPSEELKQLEQAILRQDPALDLSPAEPRRQRARRTRRRPSGRSSIVPETLDGLDALLRLAEPLAASEPPRELIIAGVVASAELGAATAALAERRDELLADGLAARTAAFSSPAPGDDVVRLAVPGERRPAAHGRGLGAAGRRGRRRPRAGALRRGAARRGGRLARAPGPVMVPFGAAWHDWAALELGAWVARATDAPLRLIGAASDERERRPRREPPARRRVADRPAAARGSWPSRCSRAPAGRASWRSPREPACWSSGSPSAGARRASAGCARQLVEAPPAPTVLVRRGPRPGGLAPAETRTRFGWSLTGSAA